VVPRLRYKTAQTWSIDLIIAMVIFILIITIFYAMISSPETTRTRELQEEGQKISAKLESSATACDLLDQGDISRDQLNLCFQSSVDEFRRKAGIRNRFCVYLQDQNGRTIAFERLQSGSLVKQMGFGDPELTLAGVPCGEALP